MWIALWQTFAYTRGSKDEILIMQLYCRLEIALRRIPVLICFVYLHVPVDRYGKKRKLHALAYWCPRGEGRVSKVIFSILSKVACFPTVNVSKKLNELRSFLASKRQFFEEKGKILLSWCLNSFPISTHSPHVVGHFKNSFSFKENRVWTSLWPRR